MREYLAKRFADYGSGYFNGTEIAKTIMRAKGPV